MAGNPRIDELRKKLDKEPGSRLFAQLAEELRKDGEFEDAIRVAREGLQKHQNYPSARMTLGRALFDTGDWAAARVEFEQVLKGAPDNILASRLLAESLEGLGDVEGAVARYKKTLALAPGDKQVLARLEALEKGGGSAAAAAFGAAAPAAAAPPRAGAATGLPGAAPAAAAAPPIAAEPPAGVDSSAPIRLVDVDAPMELESPHERSASFTAAPAVAPAAAPAPAATAPAGTPPSPPTAHASGSASAAAGASEPAPIPLVAAEEDFEIERPNEPAHPAAREAAHAAPAGVRPPPAPAPPAPSTPAQEAPMEFEFDAGPAPSTIPFAPAPAPSPVASRTPEGEAEVAQPEMPHRDTPTSPVVEPPPAPVPLPPPVEVRTVAVTPPPPPEPATTVEVGSSAPPAAGAAPSSPAPSPVEVRRESEGPSGELMSATLAELYFDQGFTEKAVEVYRQLLEREPGNERLRRRLEELEAPAVPTPPPAGASAATDTASRRIALERTIARLEGMLAAIKKG